MLYFNSNGGIYFHPRCPENWRWCVLDEKAKFGGLEFNHKTGTLVKRSTIERWQI